MRILVSGMSICVLLLSVIAQSSAVVDRATIEGLWLFDDAAGNVAGDSSGHNRHGDIMGEAQWAKDGRFGGGLELDGVDDEIVITGYKGIGGADPRTTLMWYRTDLEQADQRLISWGIGTNTKKYHIRLHDTVTLRVETQGGQLYSNKPNLADGNWHHLAVVFPENSTMCHEHLLYVDGALIEDTGGKDVGVDTDVTTLDMEIGYAQWIGGGIHTKGTIDEVALFSVPLTEADVNLVMQEGLSGSTLSVSPGRKLAATWGRLKTNK